MIKKFIFVMCAIFCANSMMWAGNTVYFNNSEAQWNKVYAYCWTLGGDDNEAAWPGTELTANGEGLYVYEGFADSRNAIIFNNGSRSQTPDLPVILNHTYGRYYTNVYLMGDLPGANWDSENSPALDYVGNGVYTIDNVVFEDVNQGSSYFSFSTVQGTWDVVNSFDRIFAKSKDEPINAGDNPWCVIEKNQYANAWSIPVADKNGKKYTYKLTVDVPNYKIKVEYSNTTGVDAVEAADAAPAVYFNLQGVAVESPENGIFIVKRGNKVTKEFIR